MEWTDEKLEALLAGQINIWREEMNFFEWARDNAENLIALYLDYLNETRDVHTTFADFVKRLWEETEHYKAA